MGKLTKPTYAQIVTTIRELIFDVSPVACYSLTKQGLSLAVDSNGYNFTGDTTLSLLFEDNPKFYDMVVKFKQANLSLACVLSLDYIPNEYSNTTTEFTGSLATEQTLYRPYYFSEETIVSFMYQYFVKYYDYEYAIYWQELVGTTETGELEQMLSDLSLRETYKLILWVSFHLLEKQRMNVSSVSYLKKKNGETVDCENEFTNLRKTFSTKLGDTFTVNEDTEADGLGTEGFTSLWGDKYSYLTKLQLYVRTQLEKIYGDFSLRDNAINSVSFTLEKTWVANAYNDTISLSPFTKDILHSSEL